MPHPLQCVVNCLFFGQAREAVEMRAQLEKKMAQKRKEEKEENLRALAQKAREERAGIRRADGTVLILCTLWIMAHSRI